MGIYHQKQELVIYGPGITVLHKLDSLLYFTTDISKYELQPIGLTLQKQLNFGYFMQSITFHAYRF